MAVVESVLCEVEIEYLCTFYISGSELVLQLTPLRFSKYALEPIVESLKQVSF
jgi:hypothetical protein